MTKEKQFEKDKEKKAKKTPDSAKKLGDDDLSKVSGGCDGGPGEEHHADKMHRKRD